MNFLYTVDVGIDLAFLTVATNRCTRQYIFLLKNTLDTTLCWTDCDTDSLTSVLVTVGFMIQPVWSTATQARSGFVMAVETHPAGKIQ